MKKYYLVLASALVALCMALACCEKPDDPDTPGTPNTPGGETPTSHIIATIFETPLDIYLDGKIDFAGNELRFYMPGEGSALHTPYMGVSVLSIPAAEAPFGYDEEVNLSYGDEIGPSSGYFSKSENISYLKSYWCDTTYCGVSFQKDGKTHYGWVKYTFVTISCIARIYGFAYEDAPDMSILAGATE